MKGKYAVQTQRLLSKRNVPNILFSVEQTAVGVAIGVGTVVGTVIGVGFGIGVAVAVTINVATVVNVAVAVIVIVAVAIGVAITKRDHVKLLWYSWLAVVVVVVTYIIPIVVNSHIGVTLCFFSFIEFDLR
ncbi:hypothetical protein PoB_003626600 [Plakobranchus ocellatus]|uniref:ABC transmembrane type-1 domain-containing protein n=1 Tax=Plakobranchus ocellatus TaxID=259542 RepID=A0AAV4AEZ0_9GAST|nr:hypothetical protein PoB_003626600 [Plakobranchus ocellatus]